MTFLISNKSNYTRVLEVIYLIFNFFLLGVGKVEASANIIKQKHTSRNSSISYRLALLAWSARDWGVTIHELSTEVSRLDATSVFQYFSLAFPNVYTMRFSTPIFQILSILTATSLDILCVFQWTNQRAPALVCEGHICWLQPSLKLAPQNLTANEQSNVRNGLYIKINRFDQ